MLLPFCVRVDVFQVVVLKHRGIREDYEFLYALVVESDGILGVASCLEYDHLLEVELSLTNNIILILIDINLQGFRLIDISDHTISIIFQCINIHRDLNLPISYRIKYEFLNIIFDLEHHTFSRYRHCKFCSHFTSLFTLFVFCLLRHGDFILLCRVV